MRVLVTASRTWDDRELMDENLRPFFAEDNVLVSGHCKEGGDAMAEELWAGYLGMTAGEAMEAGHIEIHPADWSKGRAAGFARNNVMIESGIDVCLVFARFCARKGCRDVPHYTHGTAHCARRAAFAGIRTVLTAGD